MRGFSRRALGLIGMGILLGCTMDITQGPPPGLFFTQISGPLAVAPNQERMGSKRGEACGNLILGIVSIGDASLDQAMADAGIEKVETISYSIMSVLGGIYWKYCVIVTGD